MASPVGQSAINRAAQQIGAGYLSPTPSVAPVNLQTNPYGLGVPGAQGAYGAASQGYYGGFPNPFAGNIYKGLPTTIGQTPYGPLLNQQQQYNYNPNQLRQIANQQTGAQISAGLGASYANQAAEQYQLGAMQNRASGLAAALGSFGPSYAQAMQSAYNNAAGTMASVGPGVVAQGQQAEQGNLDAAKASVAAATGGQGQVSSYDPAALASTLSTTGVQMPGNSLALQGYNAAQMGLYGAMADKGQVQGVAQYYQQQASNELAQRTAERASIIAQRPQLFQTALEAQRQDEAQTQDRISNTIAAGQNYIASRMGLRLQSVQAQNTWMNQVAQMTHVNPLTGQPLAGYVPVTLKDGSTVVVSYGDAAKAANYASLAAYHQSLAGSRQTSANASWTSAQAAIARARAAGHQFDPKLSQEVGYLVDNNRNPIPAQGGGTIPWTNNSIGGTAYDPKLSAQVGYLVDKNRNAIPGVNGQATVPYTTPTSASGMNLNTTASAARGIEINQQGYPVIDPATQQTIPYPKKQGKPLSISDQAKLVGPMAQYVSDLATGKPATAKSAATPKATLEEAVSQLNARGWFSTPFQSKAAMNALSTYYKVTPQQIAMVLAGYNPLGGAPGITTTYAGTGVKITDPYGPFQPSGGGGGGGGGQVIPANTPSGQALANAKTQAARNAARERAAKKGAGTPWGAAVGQGGAYG
jgi:hypothetical protein